MDIIALGTFLARADIGGEHSDFGFRHTAHQIGAGTRGLFSVYIHRYPRTVFPMNNQAIFDTYFGGIPSGARRFDRDSVAFGDDDAFGA